MTRGPARRALDWDALEAREHVRPTSTRWWGAHTVAAFGGTVLEVEVTDGAGPLAALVLAGGALAPGGFVLGGIGHGALHAVDDPRPLSLPRQVDAVPVLERHLGMRCLRLVTGPVDPAPPDAAVGALRSCTVMELDNGTGDTWDTVAGNVRTAVRASRRRGLAVVDLTVSDLPDAIALVHATQERVGAAYRTPPVLLERLLEDAPHACAVGIRHEGRLVCASFFLRHGPHATYLVNGYTAVPGKPSPTYLTVWEAATRLAASGCRWLDLGHSPSASLARHKAQWSPRLEHHLAITPSATRSEHE